MTSGPSQALTLRPTLPIAVNLPTMFGSSTEVKILHYRGPALDNSEDRDRSTIEYSQLTAVASEVLADASDQADFDCFHPWIVTGPGWLKLCYDREARRICPFQHTGR